MLLAALTLFVHIASPVEEARMHTREATLRYDVRDFQGALAKYKRAYDLAPMPGLLFNIGQCHRQLRQHDKAIFHFQGYLRQAPASEHREMVEGLIAEEQRALAQRPTRIVMPAMKTSPPKVVETPVYQRWWFWTAIGAGAVVTAGAVTAIAIASSAGRPVTPAPLGR